MDFYWLWSGWKCTFCHFLPIFFLFFFHSASVWLNGMRENQKMPEWSSLSSLWELLADLTKREFSIRVRVKRQKSYHIVKRDWSRAWYLRWVSLSWSESRSLEVSLCGTLPLATSTMERTMKGVMIKMLVLRNNISLNSCSGLCSKYPKVLLQKIPLFWSLADNYYFDLCQIIIILIFGR